MGRLAAGDGTITSLYASGCKDAANGGNMPFTGTFNPVTPGTIRVFSQIATPDLQIPTPDTIVTATSTMSVAARGVGGPQYFGTDPHAPPRRRACD